MKTLILLVAIFTIGCFTKKDTTMLKLNTYEIVYADNTCDTLKAERYYERHEQIIFYIGNTYNPIKTVSLFNLKSITKLND